MSRISEALDRGHGALLDALEDTALTITPKGGSAISCVGVVDEVARGKEFTDLGNMQEVVGASVSLNKSKNAPLMNYLGANSLETVSEGWKASYLDKEYRVDGAAFDETSITFRLKTVHE